jgi:hypothetical protein
MQGCHEYAALSCHESRMALSPYFQEVVTRESRAGATRKPHLLRCASENKAVHRGSSIAFKLLQEWKHIIAKPDNRGQVQRGILNYLTQHPHAKDTLQGIIEWWLVDSRQTPGVADVQEALDELVQRGWILVTKRSPSSTLYGLDEAHLDSIREFLND